MRLIDADALLETLKNPPLHNSLGGMCLQDVFDIIADQDTIEPNKWINVQEKTPPLKNNILIYGEGGVAEGELIEEGHYIQYRWNCDADNVTHWMPFPNAPKEADK